MVSAETELIRALLGCGYADIKTMTNVMEMGEELLSENPIEKVINSHTRDEINFDGILYDAMEYIVYSLVDEIDNINGYDECSKLIYRDILDNYWSGPYTNCMDSSFQIDCLDNWRVGDGKENLLECLGADILQMKIDKEGSV